jgi:CheY-like chemotaxis protein
MAVINTQTEAPRTDRRETARFPLIFQVPYKGVAKPILQTVEALLGEGLFVATPLTYREGDVAPFIVSCTGLLDPVQLAVDVLSRRAADAKGPGGVVVRLSPRNQAERTKLTRLATEALAREPKANARRFTLLLVEDNLVVAQIYSAALEKLAQGPDAIEVQVEFARNGKEALHQLATLPRVDLVVSDLKMAGLDGFELVRRMRSDDIARAIPVVVITGERLDDKQDRELRDLRVSAMMEKPLKLDDMIATVKTFLLVSSGAH